jgi:hypothetical protein
VDLRPLYDGLRGHFADLNIEGAFVAADGFHLLQRGNRGHAVNACIRYALQDTLAWLAGAAGAPEIEGITRYDLGEAGSVPYGFTDAAPLAGGGWIFSAVAEDTQDSYADGRCAGSLLGWVDARGALQELQLLAGAPKVEGVACAGAGRVLLVTDADDPATPSSLLQVDWLGLPT